MATAYFVCVCPPKELKFGPDNAFHRADHYDKLRGVFHRLNFDGKAKNCCYLPGGGIAADADVDMSIFETCATAFTGKLANYAYLVRRYFEDEVREAFGCDPPLNLIKQMPPFPVSTLICKLYRKFGPKVVHKLRGTYSFVCYDSVMVRVFAARDPSGKLEMTLGRTKDGSIVVSSGGILPSDSCELHELPPGYYKYGWHCEPLKFAETSCTAQKAVEYAIIEESPAAYDVAADVTPLDSEGTTKKKGKTRRGTRGGRNKRKSNSPDTLQANVAPVNDKLVWWRKSDPAPLQEEASDSAPLQEEAQDIKEYDELKEVVVEKLGDEPEPVECLGAGELESAAAIDQSGNKVANDLYPLPEPLSQQLNAEVTDEASLRLLSNLLYSSPCAIAVTDATQADSPIVYVNRVFELQTGYSMAECVGKNCRFLQAPLGRDRTPSFASMSIRKALESGTKRTVRIMNFRKDGVPIWNNLSIVPMRSAQGTVTHFVGMQTFVVADEVVSTEISTAAVASQETNGVRKMQRTSSLMSKSKSCSDLAGMGGLLSNAMPSMAY